MSLQDVLNEVRGSYEFKKIITIKGTSYMLSVLTVDQERKVNTAISAYDDEDADAYVKEMRKELLSRAIVEIKGELIPDVVETPDGNKDKPIFLKEFLGTLPGTLIEKLFDAYIDLREESQKGIESEMQYDWFKTPEQRQKEYDDLTAEAEKEEIATLGDEASEAAEKAEEDKIKDVSLKPVRETEEPEIPQTAQQ